MIHAIIIDDEQSGREYLRALIEKFESQVKVIGDAANAKEGIDLIKATDPDLVFLDIEMPGETGIGMLKQLGEINFSVVFVTAFNQYAVDALRLGAIDYLLKPVDPADLRLAIKRVEDTKEECRHRSPN